MSYQELCVQCKNPDNPLTEDNRQEIFRRDPPEGGRKVVHAVIHRTCSDAWQMEHSAFLETDLNP
jgi:hypothetical protein